MYSKFRCCSVSTPSAVVIMSLAAAMFTTAWTMDEDAPATGDILDEGAVDLDLVEREALQIAQRGIAGAEIVQRDPDAELAQLMQHVERRLVVANQHRLGDLELQPAGGKAASRERRRDVQRQRLAPELDRRDVDRDADMIRPGGGLGAGGTAAPTGRAD